MFHNQTKQEIAKSKMERERNPMVGSLHIYSDGYGKDFSSLVSNSHEFIEKLLQDTE